MLTQSRIDIPPEKVRPYAVAAVGAGIPRAQLENFLRGHYTALPWALRFHAAARKADNYETPNEIGIGGSRGPGKSHAIFAQVALDDCQRFPGIKALYLRKVGKQAREQLEDLRNKVLSGVPHDFNRNSGVIRFPNGSRIIVGHFRNESDIDQYLGLEYEVIAIEETTTLTLTKYQAIRDSNRSGVPGMRPRMYNSTNPGGVGHAWYKRDFVTPYQRGEISTTMFIPATVDDNKYIDRDYRAKLEKNTGWRLRAYRYGDWDIVAGQYFSNWRDNIHVIEPFIVPQEWEIWAAMDYGFAHYNVFQIWAKDGDGNLFTIDEYAAQRQQVFDHAQAFYRMLDRQRIAPQRVKRVVAGSDVFVKRDPKSPTIAAQYKAQGILLKPAMMDRVNGWAEMLSRLGDVDRTDEHGEPAPLPPTWHVFSTCRNLIETLPMLEHNPNNPEDVLKWDTDEDGNGGDDSADCARYGLMEGHVKRRAQVKNVDWRNPQQGQPQTPYNETLLGDDEVNKLLKEAEYNGK